MINRVKEYRNRSNLTQKQLADQVFVSQRTIISIEKGHYKPSIMLAYRLGCFFHTTVEDLFCLQQNKELEDSGYENL